MRRAKREEPPLIKWLQCDSEMTAGQRRMVEIQRGDLWRAGVRTEPQLTRMAFEFALVACLDRALRGDAGVTLAAGMSKVLETDAAKEGVR